MDGGDATPVSAPGSMTTLANTNPRNAVVAAPARRIPVHKHLHRNSAGQRFPVKTQGIINSRLRKGA